MWSRKPMPVAISPWPEPSRLRMTSTQLSRVSRRTWPVRGSSVITSLDQLASRDSRLATLDSKLALQRLERPRAVLEHVAHLRRRTSPAPARRSASTAGSSTSSPTTTVSANQSPSTGVLGKHARDRRPAQPGHAAAGQHALRHVLGALAANVGRDRHLLARAQIRLHQLEHAARRLEPLGVRLQLAAIADQARLRLRRPRHPTIGFRRFSRSVTPLEVMSQMMSAVSSAGAASIAPLTSTSVK